MARLMDFTGYIALSKQNLLARYAACCHELALTYIDLGQTQSDERAAKVQAYGTDEKVVRRVEMAADTHALIATQEVFILRGRAQALEVERQLLQDIIRIRIADGSGSGDMIESDGN